MDILLPVLLIVIVTALTSAGLIFAGYKMGIDARHLDKRAAIETGKQELELTKGRREERVLAAQQKQASQPAPTGVPKLQQSMGIP